MEQIINPLIGPVSDPFKIQVGTQITLHAQGLQNTDRVYVEVVSTTPSTPGMDPCCPGPVALPEVATTEPLRCRNGARAILTAAHPWLVLDAPQDVELRARLAADDLALVVVSKGVTDSGGCHACECREPYTAVYPITDDSGNLRGYGFVTGPEEDPDATVALDTIAPGVSVWLYPSPRVGASVPVLNAGGTAVIGYAVNP